MSRKAIFLDRDGVLIDNSEHYYLWKKDQLQFVDGVFHNMKALQEKGYLLFVVSNQGGISKGLYSKADMEALHKELVQIFRNRQITIEDIVFCPHHPDQQNCLCRKPGSIMIEKLIAKYKLEKDKSFLIGDSESDIQAARTAGIEGILITGNANMLPYISNLMQ